MLAKATDAGFEAFVSADKNMPYPQSLKRHPFFLIVLDVQPNIIDTQVIGVPAIRELLTKAKPGEVHIVEGPPPKRRPR